MVRRFRKGIIRLVQALFWPFFFILKNLVPKGRVVVLHTYNRNVFRENTRYLCEHLARESDLSVYWVTDNVLVKSHLAEKGIDHISTANPLKMVWVLLRTKVVVDSGDGFINLFGICENRNTIKITTSRLWAEGLFNRADDIMVPMNQILRAFKFDYVNFPLELLSGLGRQAGLSVAE